MLACTSLVQFPPADIEQCFDCSDKWRHVSSEAVQPHYRRTLSSPVLQRTLLLEIHNTLNSLPQNHTDIEVQEQMQSYPSGSQRFDDYRISHSDNETNITATDSGLGITTEENIFANPYPTYGSETAYRVTYEGLTPPTGNENHRRLSSPFDDRCHTPASAAWHGDRPLSTISEGPPSSYLATPDQRFLVPQTCPMPVPYTMSPVDYPSAGIGYHHEQRHQFKRPFMRQNSTSAPTSQNAVYPYGTPNVDVGQLQWMPQTSTPDWQSQTYDGVSHLPSLMLDYSTCSSVNQSPQFAHIQQPGRAIMTVPPRRKPCLRPSLSESCVPRASSPALFRTAPMGQFWHPPPYEHTVDYQYQLPLPPLPPSVLVSTPRLANQAIVLPGTPLPAYQSKRSSSCIPQTRKRPISPPPSDFSQANSPYLMPIRQEPAFSGDLYTPRYKRRTKTGRWEGWCGHCSPGRWLDLKNSRYWEDKLRNHGICAKTKMKFDEPEDMRWVGNDGTLLSKPRLSENRDPFVEQKKREGLCGVCKTWVGMDGMRTKARDRAVGWWMHAYKCHDHDKALERQNITT